MRKTWMGWGVIAVFLLTARSEAVLLYGLDVKAESSVGGADATLNEYTGFGVDIDTPTTLANWFTSAGGVPTFNSATGGVTLNGVTGNNPGTRTLTFKVSLTGTHDVTFDKFAVQLRRVSGGVGGNVDLPSFSTDGTNFTTATLERVNVGLQDGTNNVGPVDTVTTAVGSPATGFDSTIRPTQVYLVTGLGSAGVRNTGSFWIRLRLASGYTGNQNIGEDRADLTTTAMSLSATNTSDLGADDGYDIAWYGSAVAVPEPGAFLFGGIATCLAGLAWRRRR